MFLIFLHQNAYYVILIISIEIFGPLEICLMNCEKYCHQMKLSLSYRHTQSFVRNFLQKIIVYWCSKLNVAKKSFKIIRVSVNLSFFSLFDREKVLLINSFFCTMAVVAETDIMSFLLIGIVWKKKRKDSKVS